jgi:dipeptidyl aminopeptidase/acylaminoacyl peptidase
MCRLFQAVVLLAMLAAASAALAAEPPPIEAYGRLPAVSDLTLSPSGKRAAFVVNNAAGRRIAVQEVGGKLLVTIDPGVAKLSWIRWAGEDHLLVATSATVNMGFEYGFKHELMKVLVLNLSTLKTMTVFERTQSISNVVFGYGGFTEKGGHSYGFFRGVTLEGEGNHAQWIHGYADLYQVDLDSGDARIVARGDERDHEWVVAADGQMVATATYRPREGIWRLHAGAGDAGREILTVTTPLYDVDLDPQGRTAGTVLVHDYSGAEDVYEEVSLADGKAQPLFSDYTLKSLIYDQNTRLLLGAEVRGPDAVVLFDPALQAKVRGAFKAFPGRHVELVSYDPSFDQMVVKTDGADDSGTYWYVDIPGRSAVPLGQARPDVPSQEVGPTRMFAYKASDGLALEGVLTLPPGRDPKGLALVVMPHGGPLGYRDDVGFDWWAQAFASRGYAVFQPNYRGSGGYGLEFKHKGYGEYGRKMLSDMTDGVDALAAAGIIDPHRACIVGMNYGGYAALAGVTLQQGRFRCAVSVAGVSDLWAMRRRDLEGSQGPDDFYRYWQTAIHGEAKDEPSLGAISPSRHAGAADAPVLLIHGKDDTVVPIDQSRIMSAALKGAGKPVQLIELEGLDHWMTDETRRIQVLKASVDFVLNNDPPN